MFEGILLVNARARGPLFRRPGCKLGAVSSRGGNGLVGLGANESPTASDGLRRPSSCRDPPEEPLAPSDFDGAAGRPLSR